jgi:hypothetical protein
MKQIEEVVSLNTTMQLFEMEKLEQRLETDPLAVSGMLDLESNEATASDSEWCIFVNLCGED